MDSTTMIDYIAKGVGCGVMKPNEGRFLLNASPVEGGDTPYLQQQNYSLAALAKRDADEATPPPEPPPPNAPDDEPDDADEPADDAEDATRFQAALLAKVQRFTHAA
jgi:hypothetical protein